MNDVDPTAPGYAAIFDPPLDGGVPFDNHDAALAYARRVRAMLCSLRRIRFDSIDEMRRIITP
jgi:hypothetical protein